MSTKSFSGKIIALIFILLVGAAAAYGYFQQSSSLSESPAAQTDTEKNAKRDYSILNARPNDIILGDPNALVTIVEYNSLSCSHCAAFHESVLPDLDKEFITTGKVKLVLRHFPLNPPALKGSQLVECSGQKGSQRATFMKVLFSMQAKWAFSDSYEKDLKQIASLGGIDSAAFDSCIKDKSLETQIITGRQEAQDKLGVDSTPAFFINGKPYEGDRSIEGFRKAIAAAAPSGK